MVRRIPFSLLVLGIAAGAADSPGPDVVDCGGGVVLRFDAHGFWNGLRFRGVEMLRGGRPDLDLLVSGKPSWPTADAWKRASVDVVRESGRVRILVERRAAGWQVRMRYDADTRARLIRRRATVTVPESAKVRVRGAIMRIPWVLIGGAPDAVWSLPAEYPFVERRIKAAQPGRRVREQGWTRTETGIGYAWSASLAVGVTAGYRLIHDRGFAAFAEESGRVSIEHEFRTLARLDGGAIPDIGEQYIGLVDGDRSALKAACREMARETAGGPPSDRPDWVDGAVIAELHPWGRLEDWSGGDRGNRFRNLTLEVPWLQRLGVTGVWLLPVTEKPPWVYHLPRFGVVHPQLGTEEELRAFIRKAHEAGMHVLMDLVTYGVAPDSPEVATFPDDVWCRNEQGEKVKVWGGSVLAADCTHPVWRERMIRRALLWVERFGCDGFRLDCGGVGQTPNWRPRSGVRANSAMFAGGIGQNVLLRKAIRSVNPDAVLMPEAGANAHFRAADMLFDYPLYLVLRELVAEPDRKVWVRRLLEWLESRQYTLTPEQEAAQVRFLENHDCVSAAEFFGVGPSQALAALLAFLPGVMLLHQDEEIGFAAELQQWLRLRRTVPALRSGEGDYRHVRASDPHVLAFARVGREDIAVVAVNLSSVPVTCTLSWPAEWDRRFPSRRNFFAGDGVDSPAVVRIPPWRPVVLGLGSGGTVWPQDTPPRLLDRPEPGSAGDASPTVSRTDEDGKSVFRFSPVDTWYLATHEGVLAGFFRDRHRAVRPGELQSDAIAPLRRCFHPLGEGLFDGPGPVRVGAAWHDAWVEIVCPGVSLLRDLTIADPSNRGRDVRMELAFANGENGAAKQVRQETGRDFAERVRFLRGLPTLQQAGPVRVDPLFVRLEGKRIRPVIARRLGGSLLRILPETVPGVPWPADRSEVYSDNGLFPGRVHAGSLPETNPRLYVESGEGGAGGGVTFRGRLRRPPWNGVQSGPVMHPVVEYRVTYRLVGDAALRVEVGMTASKPVPEKRVVFFGWRMAFQGVRSWDAGFGNGPPASGRVGTGKGRRVFQTRLGPWKQSDCLIHLYREQDRLTIFVPRQESEIPANVFLLDGGRHRIHLFAAVFDGPARVEAGREYALAFELRGPFLFRGDSAGTDGNGR